MISAKMNTKLQKAFTKCKAQCDKLGIKYGGNITISPTTRVLKKWGSCRIYPHNFGFDIKINRRLLDDDVKEMALLDTVMHELLHTCPGCGDHGATWKKYADMVNKAYGYNVKRCTSYEEKGMETPPRPVAKYRFMCKNCGTIVSRQRASAFTKNPSGYVCGKCGGKFIVL